MDQPTYTQCWVAYREGLSSLSQSQLRKHAPATYRNTRRRRCSRISAALIRLQQSSWRRQDLCTIMMMDEAKQTPHCQSRLHLSRDCSSSTDWLASCQKTAGGISGLRRRTPWEWGVKQAVKSGGDIFLLLRS